MRIRVRPSKSAPPPPANSRAIANGRATLGDAVVALLRDRRFLANALAGGFGNAAMFAYISGSPFVLIELHHVPANRYALYFGANAAALIVASQLNARLAQRQPLAPLARRSGLFVGAAASYQQVFYPGTDMQFITANLRAGLRF